MKRNNIESLIELIRKRPAMYIGEPKIYNLSHFLFGYSFAMYENFNMQEFQKPLRDFNDWLETKYKCKASIGWARLLLLHVNDNEDMAFDLFWEEWDDFLSQRFSEAKH